MRRRWLGGQGVLPALALLVLLVVFVGAGCGYHTVGQASRLPKDLHTIAVPAFENQTSAFRIEQLLTAAVVRELQTRTHYRVVNQLDAGADATLRGTVAAVQIAPVTYSSQTGRASSALVVVIARVSLVDRQGKVLFENPGYIFREQYEISQDPASFFQEESPAFERLARDFSRGLVANVLEAY